jgi:hypothetical protein
LKNLTAKISLFILIGISVLSCDTTKRVPNGKKLLNKNQIFVDKKAENTEEIVSLLYQKENSSILGYKLRLHIFNQAKLKNDSLFKLKMIHNPKKYYRKSKLLSKKQVKRYGESFYVSGFNKFLQKTGEAPVLLDTNSALKSVRRLNSYYFNKGFFDVNTKFIMDSIGKKRVNLKYEITKGKPYIIDSIKTNIASKPLDSIYQLRKDKSLIRTGRQFALEDFENEKVRITTDFRNNGAFYFQQNYIKVQIDTIGKKHNPNVAITIGNQSISKQDSTKVIPFELYKITKVNVFTDHSVTNQNKPIKDSINFKDVNLYSVGKLKYKPKAITDGVFIYRGNYYSDNNNVTTSKYISNLKVFNYPLIEYKEDKNQKNGLIANIYLTPRKKFSFNYNVNFTHSNIPDFGISGSTGFSIRNVFNRAETFDFGLRGNIGSSRDLANPNNVFFNISEFGIDSRLNFPRVLLPFSTDKVLPKRMIPFTTMSIGFARQQNIGLDRQSLTSTLTYSWTPKKNTTVRFDLFNIQFVRNLNISNYFNVYRSSYNSLNALAAIYNTNTEYLDESNNLIIDQGTNGFLNDVLGPNPSVFPSRDDFRNIQSIEERRQRLIENNLIFSSIYSYSRTNRKDFFDNQFYSFKGKIETAGNFLALMAKLSKSLENQNGANTFFDVEYSQFIKTDLEYVKHWTLGGKMVFAVRNFIGLAIPYGNSKNIPFARSYFAGGSNDNRAWQSYGLGPGETASINDFNEANMKLAFSAEFRFNIFQKLNGAIFADAGNIWNVLDDVTNPDAQFVGLESLKNTALGTGFGFRYDLNFFVVRFDVGFKTYNPALTENNRWFNDIRFNKSVLNIGINYPF